MGLKSKNATFNHTAAKTKHFYRCCLKSQTAQQHLQINVSGSRRST